MNNKENQTEISVPNYLDLLVDNKIDEITNCPICISGISHILQEMYLDLKRNIPEGSFQKFMKERSLLNILQWKNNWYPIPLPKLNELLKLWEKCCNKTSEDNIVLYNKIFQEADCLKAKCSPVNVKAIKSINPKLAYLLGVLYADGALRDIWLTLEKEARFRWEITITDEHKENLQIIVNLLEELFGINTNVKTVYAGKWYRILFQSMILFRILNRLFEMPAGYKKGKLRIPKPIMNSPLEIKKHFLIGFFDGDGACSRYNSRKKFTPFVSVSQSSKGILLDVEGILNEMNFNFRLHEKKRKGFVWYVLETKDKLQIKRFHNKLGFLYPNKKERLRVLIESFD